MTHTPERFDLNLSEDQELARQSARRFAEAEMRKHARDADERAAAPQGFYDKTLELALNFGPIPEALGGGGAGRTPMANVLVAEDLAQGDMALAIGALSPLGVVHTLVDHATDEQQQRWLPRFAEERFVPSSVALMEPKARFEPSAPSTLARKRGEEYVLSGVKSMVPLGPSAELVIVIANLEDGGPAAFVVEKDTRGVSFATEKPMGLRALELGRMTLDEVKVPAAAKLGGDDTPFDLRRFVDLSGLGTCALSLGVCQAVVDYVKEYCNERVAFGEPISHRQSVAFMVADMWIELEAMRLMVYRAASRAERGLDFHQQAYLARVACAERSMQIGTNGVQLLGGHGYIREHPVEMWYRNLRAIGILEGFVCV